MYLAEKGADVNAVNERDCTPLLYAALEGMDGVVKYLLEKGAKHKSEAGMCYNTKVDKNMRLSPLDAASACGHLSIVDALITIAKVDPSVKSTLSPSVDANDKENATKLPLTLACLGGHEAVVKKLIAAGATSDVIDDGMSLVMYAALSSNDRMCTFLLTTAAKKNVNHIGTNCLSPLYVAAMNGMVNSVKMMLSAGAQVEFVNTNDGSTPLFIAAAKGHDGVVNELLKRKANPHVKLTNGKTIIEAAQLGNHDDIVETLKEALGEA
jgi:ankyrin repeat protein